MRHEELNILAVNPGSTTTKIAVYANKKELFRKSVEHSVADLSKYGSLVDQLPLRKEAIMACLAEARFPLSCLSAVAGRGGKLPPLKRGAYLINKAMVEFLTNHPIDEHASNLGAIIAYELASLLNIPSYIYDAVVVDELDDIARLSGTPELVRRASFHVLNMRACALRIAEKLNRRMEDLNVIVVHMGGGISMTVIKQGRMVDGLTDEEGPFSPERTGRVPCRQLVDLCYSEKYDHYSAIKKVRGNGGLVAYLGTNNAQEVEKMINIGDSHAELVYHAMAYQVAKGIGELAVVVDGKVDVIIITGGVAYSRRITGWIRKMVEFIAPLEIIPGENELEALAFGTLRVLKGEEIAHEFVAP